MPLKRLCRFGTHKEADPVLSSKTMNRKLQFMLKDRIAYKYFECCRLEKESGAVITAKDGDKESFPYGRYAVILLGPGCSITHAAVSAISQAGCGILWCSKNKFHLYQAGSPLSGSTALLRKQAKICSSERLSLQAAKRMFLIRYPAESTAGMTQRQLLCIEGRKMQEAYQSLAEKHNIEWSGRNYNHKDYNSNEPIQKAITISNKCLYAVVQAVVLSLGMSPGLGVIHKRNERALVFDIADLYKEKLTLPYVFKRVGETGALDEKQIYEDLEILFSREKIVRQIIKDIKTIFIEEP